ncbi:hypothetical protein PMIN03_011903 [Paraphaeosphaeria minitans]
MDAAVSKTRRSHIRLPEYLQETLLAEVASIATGTELSPDQLEQSPDQLEQSPERKGLSGDTTPVLAWKRRLDATSDPVPVKRARFTRTNTRQPGINEKTTLQQPNPIPPKHPYASFYKDFVDPVDPRPRPPSPHTVILEWLESVGSDREKHSRSDSHLHSDSELFSRQLTRSAPEIYKRGAKGFAVPATPPSTGYRAPHAGSVVASDDIGTETGRSSARSLIEGPFYRQLNLTSNNIYMRGNHDKFPDDVANLVRVVTKARNSPEPSLDELSRDPGLGRLEIEGLDEFQVEKYFHDRIFSDFQQWDSLDRADRQPMAKHAVPSTGSKYRVSNPVPDSLFGYHPAAFPQQQAQLLSMGAQPMANSQRLYYPFLVVEFKGNGGDLWAATNQCLGGSTSCVYMAERLNEQLRKCQSHEIKPINSAAFSIAMSGTEARLYISWKHDELVYCMQKIKGFYLQDPEQFIIFRGYIRNIIDWGKEERLEEIRKSLDSLLGESIRRASEAAKSRQPPPVDTSGSSSGKKR